MVNALNASVASAECGFCGLPVGRRTARESGEVYCCAGCRFAATFALAGAEGIAGENRRLLARLGLAVFCTMNVAMLTMVLWTRDVYDDPAGAPASATPLEASLNGLIRYACLALSTPVLLLLGPVLWQQAWDGLCRRRLTAELLMILGVASATATSVYSVLRGAGHVYFEVACVVLVAATLGRLLVAVGKQKTLESLAGLERLLPDRARLVVGETERDAPAAGLAPGDVVRVLAGERIPTDGVVISGRAAIDERMITGESRALEKGPGDSTFGGAINLDGDLKLTVSAPCRGGTLRRLIEAVERARRLPMARQRLADRISGWFLPGIAVVALGTLAWHVPRAGWEAGMLAALAVVLIACPCALGLATPLAVWSAMNAAARRGILFSQPEAMERLAEVRAVAFDKTGTLTTGRARVAEWAAAGAREEDVLGRAAGLAGASNHVYSGAVAAHARDCHAIPLAPENVRAWPGLGVSGAFVATENAATPDAPTSVAYLGSPRLMRERRLDRCATGPGEMDRLLAAPLPVACIGWDGAIRGAFSFCEDLREDAAAAIAQCRDLGLAVQVLTGDRAVHAAQLADRLNVPVAAELLPEDKAAAIQRLRAEHGPTAMVGDGVNDAPALASADVGIALGCGADLSRESAAVCLVGNELTGVPWAVALARQTLRAVRFNLFWAFAYNVAGVGMAIAGQLNPTWAALAMVASSALVVGNSLRVGSEES